MKSYDIYKDIATRSSGDIYFGVVGPVRTGKSTFIAKFMENLVMPHIEDKYEKERALDELPQSAEGTRVMTTEPKFVPNQAVKIKIDNVQMKVRLIDCVGYMVKGASGHIENEKPRLVKTPWSKEPMPFEKAAELGTKKVINEHSTVGIMVTTDGSISDIDRASYIEAEARVVKELKQTGKPFVIVLNTKNPKSENSNLLKESLEEKYNVPVVIMDILNLSLKDINEILEKLLLEFPVVSFDFKMPRWLEALPFVSTFIQEIATQARAFIENKTRMGEFVGEFALFDNSENFEPIQEAQVDMGRGRLMFVITPKPELFYRVLSEQTGAQIENDHQLVGYLKHLAHAKVAYDKLKDALDSVEETGYGVVVPTMEEMILAEPQTLKQGNRYGVKLRASAPSLHIMRVDIETEVSPIVGTEQQSSELVKSLLSEFESNPQGLWDTKIFGKSLHMLVNEGVSHKLTAMPIEAQRKMRKTLGRIVNEGKGGIICILL